MVTLVLESCIVLYHPRQEQQLAAHVALASGHMGDESDVKNVYMYRCAVPSGLHLLVLAVTWACGAMHLMSTGTLVMLMPRHWLMVCNLVTAEAAFLNTLPCGVHGVCT
jgi:hypothetical protein